MTSMFKGGAAMFIYSEVDVSINISNSIFQVNYLFHFNLINDIFIGKFSSYECFK